MSIQQHVLIAGGNGVANSNPTLQHYLTNNHIITNGADPQQGKNVHVQIVKQEQQQQRYILNQRYIHQNQPQQQQHLQIQSAQQQQQIIQEVPIYWLIVEIESNNELNSYAFVDSKDVIGFPTLESLTTGKLVVVNINNKQRRATVVMASSDKSFIIAEYTQLNKMAEDNLKLRESQVRKRRRISGSDLGRKDPEDDSSLSAWSGVSQNNVNSERVVSPSPHIQSRTKITYDRNYCPPMTYDQGTQTDPRFTGSSEAGAGDRTKELLRLIEINEQILNEQKQLRNETRTNRYLIESFNEEFQTVRKNLQSVENKIDNFSYDRQGHYETISTHDPQIVDKKVKILNGSENGAVQPYYIIETAQDGGENASMSLTGSNVEYAVEELEADDSGRSTSRMSYHDQASMMSNTSIDCKKSFRRSHSSSNFSVLSSTPLTRSTSSSNLIEEWNEQEGDIPIGSNQTMVPVHVLRSIDWKNFKTATRKLLVSLFPRQILASRSLTGRPSPAFHDRNKPVKEKLDQNIINDIIQIITRKCGVHESQVRTAITTKCADENKMMRNREGKSKNDESFKTPSDLNLSSVVDNKENIHGN